MFPLISPVEGSNVKGEEEMLLSRWMRIKGVILEDGEREEYVEVEVGRHLAKASR